MTEIAFARLARLGEQLQQTTKRRDMTRLLADFLKDLTPEEIPPSVRLIIGRVFPEWDSRALNLSWKAVMAVVDSLIDAPQGIRDQAAAEAVDGGEFVFLLFEQSRRLAPRPPPLTVLEVFHIFEEIAGTAGRGSRARKESLLHALLERATPLEAKYLAKVIYQEMRHGVSEGLMLDGIAQAAGVKARLVRRANQLWGDLGEVALVALTTGETGLRKATVHLFRPLKPMLAQTVENLTEASKHFEDRLALEYKLDGARIQIHRRGSEVRIYSRNLADVTRGLPDIVEEVKRSSAAEECILEGEAIAVDAHGRPLPFQHLMRRFRRKHEVLATIEQIPVDFYLFDALHVNGAMLLDLPYRQRWAALETAATGLKLVPRLIPDTIAEGEAFAEQAHRDGHEGVMVKGLESTYAPGVRGRSWLKLKHVMSLDLVIVAADWGYGRRTGWLSNYHLAALNEDTGEYLVVGKTFKGPTDVEFQQLTERLLSLERSRRHKTVFVEPRLVVEVLFNEIQQSNQYKSGLALRFARVARLREDKHPAEADTLHSLRKLHEEQFLYKGQPA